jgi:hypothetical protein
MSSRLTSLAPAPAPAFAVALCVAVSAASVRAETPKPAAPAAAADAKIVEVRFEPPALTLKGPRDARRFVVTGKTADGQRVDLTRTADIKVSGAAAMWAGGFVEPVSDGTATVTAKVGGLSAELPVTVSGAAAPTPVSFVRDVMPMLGKAGCNQGACHGGQKGRNGFKLSLRGYDPDFDHAALADEIAGRRIDLHNPANSLILLKPTNDVPHEGRFIFGEDHRYYRMLLQWVTEGARSDIKDSPRVTGIEVLPVGGSGLPDVGREQQLIVVAKYSDGSTRDVTRDAVYSSSADTVATVTGEGLVKGVRKGEAAVLIRYEGQFAVSPVTVLVPSPDFRWTPPAGHNRIDELVDAKLLKMRMNPSPICDDADFLRRVYLDLTGVPPSPEEVRAFLSDKTETKAKRAAVIDRLLASAAYADFLTLKWADLMQANRKYLGERGVWAFRNWIREQVASDRPWNEVAAEMLTGVGSTAENPASAFFRIAKEPEQAVETTTHLFLGIRFNCNKCHDHPFERWTQGDYYHLAAFYGQVGVKKSARKDDEIVYERDGGEVKHQRTGQVSPPRFPYPIAGADDSPGTVSAKDGTTRRERLAAWITSPANPYFAKSMANRLFAHMTGKGIIDPVDDIRAGNPPANPELLEFLTAEFVKGGMRVKPLLRLIANSRTYQASILPTADNVDDADNFSHARPRRLGSEQLLDSLRAATGTRNSFAGLPGGYRACQLPDPAAGSGGFLEQFGRPVRESPCECERRNEMSLGQALTLVNGPTVSEAIAAADGRIAKLFAQGNPDDRRIVEEMYLAALCRPPTAKEIENAAAILAKTPDKRAAAQDLMWALLNTPAFLFNR